jgi:glycosyltransferase involved in cell wall biosynthesis
MSGPRVVVLRGTAASPWELRPWERLHAAGEADVTVVVPPDNQYDTTTVGLPKADVGTVGARLPSGRVGQLLLKGVGQRYTGLQQALTGADVVHAAELGYWFSWQAARLKPRLGFKLVLTVWETLPFVDAYRNVRTRRYRRDVLAATDLFLAVTERARDALLLEGAPAERIEVCPPGIDVERFATGQRAAPVAGSRTLLSIGRLVWEKGHQDLLRAVALLRTRGHGDLRVAIVGVGPEEQRLRAVADDLGLAGAVDFRGGVPHDEVAGAFAAADALVLASIPTPYWEEQFGMVLAEAMAAHLPVVAAASGAIPEVLGGYGDLFEPGDWRGLADVLAAGPLARPPATRTAPDPALLERYSSVAAAERLRTAYAGLLGR